MSYSSQRRSSLVELNITNCSRFQYWDIRCACSTNTLPSTHRKKPLKDDLEFTYQSGHSEDQQTIHRGAGRATTVFLSSIVDPFVHCQTPLRSTKPFAGVERPSANIKVVLVDLLWRYLLSFADTEPGERLLREIV